MTGYGASADRQAAMEVRRRGGRPSSCWSRRRRVSTVFLPSVLCGAVVITERWQGAKPSSQGMLRGAKSEELCSLTDHDLELDRPFVVPSFAQGDQLNVFRMARADIDYCARHRLLFRRAAGDYSGAAAHDYGGPSIRVGQVHVEHGARDGPATMEAFDIGKLNWLI